MARWVDFIRERNPDLVWRHGRGSDYGDWLSVDAETPKDLLATAFFAQSARLVADSFELLGDAEEAKRYGEVADGVTAAFGAEFVGPDGRLTVETQTGYALALRFDLLSAHQRAVAAERLAADVEERGHLTTGFVGVRHLLPALTDIGRLDLAYRLLQNDDYPSWGYSVRHGATTIWERWDGWTEERGFQSPGMNSFNHYAFGAVGEWLFEVVGGIAPDQTRPGFRHVHLAPKPGGGLTSAEASLDSPYGRISCAWTLVEERLSCDVDVPANVTATLTLPVRPGQQLLESGAQAVDAEGIVTVGAGDGLVTAELGSGSYSFVVAAP
jgi:alpha-L-rhamnosidase